MVQPEKNGAPQNPSASFHPATSLLPPARSGDGGLGSTDEPCGKEMLGSVDLDVRPDAGWLTGSGRTPWRGKGWTEVDLQGNCALEIGVVGEPELGKSWSGEKTAECDR